MSVLTPPTPRHDDPEALIEEAWELTRRRRRRRIVSAVLVLGLIAIAVSFGVTRSGGQTRHRLGGPLGSGAGRRVRFAGRVWYSRTIANELAPDMIIPRSEPAGEKFVDDLPLVYFRTRTSYETWIARDGSYRQRVVALADAFASAAGRRRWLAARQPLPQTDVGSDGITVGNGEFPAGLNDSPSDPGDSLFSAQTLLGLGGSPRALSRRLEDAQRALIGRQRYEQAYVRPGPHHARDVALLVHRNEARDPLAFDVLDAVSSLAISPIANHLRRRLLNAASVTPGVRTSSTRSRVTLSVPGFKNVRSRIVFDRRSGTLLQGMPQAPGTIVAQGIVNSLGALPHGVRPIAARDLPAPPIPLLAPATGTSDTTFSLTLPAAAVGSARPPRVSAEMMGPTGPDCHYHDSNAGVASIPAGTNRGEVDSFTVTPAVLGRRAWCSGRYGLQIAVGNSPLGTGSGSTIYFTVH